MKPKKNVISIVFILVMILIVPLKMFSSDSFDWLVRYNYNDEIIQNLIKEKEKEQTEVNVQPQKDNTFDIVIFMGQSNIVGKGDASQAVEPIDGAGYEIQFNSQGEPYGLSKIKEPFGESTGSMVTAFMNSYYLNTGVPVIGIPAGIKGTSIYTTWQNGQEGLENAKTKYEKTYKWAKDNGYNVRHSYMIWYQGEEDRGHLEHTYDKGPTITYEEALKNTISEMQNVGIEKSFLICIGGYYVLEGYESDENKIIYTDYQNMIQHQLEICENNDWVTLVSTRAATLTKCSNMMNEETLGLRYGNHLNQEALDIVGSEAGKNVAKYADQARGKTLTQKQSEALINFAKQFAKDGFEARKLVYGINNKAAAYNLQLAQYKQHTTDDGLRLIRFGAQGEAYGWNGETAEQFVPNDYIGLDCSGFVSFLYHYVFGLPFNYLYNNMNVPWSTKQFIENRLIPTYDGNSQIEAFKVVYEQHAKEQKYTINDLASLAILQPGDLLIGRGGATEGDDTNHIVVYSGKDENGIHKMIHSTSSPEHYELYEENNGIKIYYYAGESKLNKSQFKFRNVYVLRLNNNIIPVDYVHNDKRVDWGKLSTNYPYDNIEPRILEVEGNLNDWTNQDITLKVNAIDNERGLSDKAYSFDGGENWQESNEKTFSENCNVNIQVRDKAGNIQTTSVEINKIDKNAPTILEVEGNAKQWTNQDITIKVNAEDSESRLSDKAYSFDGGENWQESNEKTFSENCNVNIQVRDEAGNIQTTSVEINKIDKNAPTILEVEGNITEWTNQDITIKVNAEDSESRLSDKAYSFDGGKNWQESNEKRFTENCNVNIQVRDKAGNIQTTSVEINKIDKNAPTILEVEGNAKQWTNQDITLKVNATDNEIGLADEAYSFDGGQSWQESNEKRFTENCNVNIQVRDKAGNIQTTSVEINKIDKNAPTILEVEGNATQWTNQDITLKVNATDNEIGLADEAYSFDGGQSWQESNEKTFSENCNVNIQVRDKAGNIETTSIEISKIDKKAPIITGVENGKMYNKQVTPIVNEDNLNSVTLTKNGIEVIDYKVGTAIIEVGKYEIRAIDRAGNTTTVSFEIYISDIITSEEVIVIEEELIINDIKPKTTVNELKQKLNAEMDYEIIDRSGNIITESSYVGTGCKIKMENDKVYILIIPGDCNGDGDVTVREDIIKVNAHRISGSGLREEYLIAADVDGNGKISVRDIILMNSIRLNKNK